METLIESDFADHQPVAISSSRYKASVMRSIARTPAFIQLDSEQKLTGIEILAGFGCVRANLFGGNSCTRKPFHLIAGSVSAVIALIASIKPNKSGTVWPPKLMSLSTVVPMVTSFATVISTVSGVLTLKKPAGIKGTLRRAASRETPPLNVSCSAVAVRELSMNDAYASSHEGVMVWW